MKYTKFSATQARMTCGILFAAASLLLAIPAVLLSPAFARGGADSLRASCLLLVVPAVFLVCRYARISAVVKVLGALLLVSSIEYALRPPDLGEMNLAKAVATGLCGIGFLLSVRWTSLVWYCIVAFATASWLEFVKMDQLNGWNSSITFSFTLASGLLLLTICGGGSVAVASHFSAKPWLDKKALALVGLSTICAAGVFAQWLNQQTPDTPGFAQLHPSIRPEARRLHGPVTRACDAIRYCGSYVQLSCHPETDGPVMYYNNDSGKLLLQCTHWCLPGPDGVARCPVCPPQEWTACVGSSSRGVSQ